MATITPLRSPGEVRVAAGPAGFEELPGHFSYVPDVPPEGAIAEVIDEYNRLYSLGGVAAVYGGVRQREVASNGLSFVSAGEAAATLVLLVNPFANGLQLASKRFRGAFLHRCLEAEGVVGPDGRTPQVVQIGMPSHDATIPLSLPKHLRVAHGNVQPVADKVADLVFENFPRSEQIASIGYSLAGFLLPDELISLKRHRDPLLGLIANPPGVRSDGMRHILHDFAHCGSRMFEHLKKSGLHVLDPQLVQQQHGLLSDKAVAVADVISRPANLSLWRAFTHGNLLERVQTLKARVPGAQVKFAFGREDPICSPDHLERFLRYAGYETAIIENGDHAWGYNLPRSMGMLATRHIKQALQPAASELALAA